MLIDVAEAYGVDTIAQVDLGQRIHQHQSDGALARMSAHVMQAALDRLHRASGRARARQQWSARAVPAAGERLRARRA